MEGEHSLRGERRVYIMGGGGRGGTVCEPIWPDGKAEEFLCDNAAAAGQARAMKDPMMRWTGDWDGSK